jgi:hypothetical protein
LPHAFLSSIRQAYGECAHCDKRKIKVCPTCGYCYTCHPVSEQIERRPKKSYFAIGNLFDIESAAR